MANKKTAPPTDMSNYSGLSRAQLSYDYLHTNSTTHEFLFGALAELVDNARDALATKINIYTVPDASLRGGYMLCFLDDGEGMDHDKAADIITFGRSSKRSFDTESQLIGMYGNGLKSGSMRIGNDLMVFTKRGPTMSCVFLSRTFHEVEEIEEIIVPMPLFESTTKKPTAKGAKQMEKHNIEMSLILKYSPFKTLDRFLKEFDKIEGNSGSLIIIYNMKLLDSGDPELDVKTDPLDILLSNPETGEYDTDEGMMPERRSFRAYTSVLYVDPRMRIYIQGKKVRTKRLANCLYRPRMYKYSSTRFKTRAENEAKKAVAESKAAENRAREAESKLKDLENKFGTGTTKEQRAEFRRTQTSAIELRKEAQIRKQMADRKTRALRDPKTLNFIFGMNIEQRGQDGMFVYNCSRLIKMYQKVGPQADGGVFVDSGGTGIGPFLFCSGVVGIVDVPYLILEPTHNKQDFADAKEYRLLQKAMGEHMVQYWKDVGIAQQGVTKFWENFGYTSPNWKDPPSTDPKYVRKRAMQIQVTLQCDVCLKWRMLPFSANNIGKVHPDDWICSMNPDPSHARCSALEQKLNIPEGVLKKENRSKEQKEKDLQEEIRKKQEKLEKMQKTVVVSSAKQAKEVTEEKSRRPSKSPAPSRRTPRRAPSPVEEEEEEEEEASEEEEEEEEEEEVVKSPPRKKAPPPAKSKPVRSAATRSSPAVSSRSSFTPAKRATTTKRKASQSSEGTRDMSEEEDEETEVVSQTPPKKKPAIPEKSKPTKAAAAPSSRKTASTTSATSMDSDDDDQTTAMEADDGGFSSEDGEGEVGTKVEAKVQGKWYTGTVVQSNRKQAKWKIKFDKNPRDKYDKWFDQNSSDIKIVKLSQSTAESSVGAPASPASVSSQDVTNETPSSSTAAAGGAAGMGQLTEDIANGYRTCLRYFLPPQWVMDKDAVSTLTVQELAAFPLDDFFDHYEKGLRKLVSSFQQEATSKQQESETAKTKLSSVRKMIAKLLKSINEEFDIDPESDSDQVDELLAACVKQALQQQGQQD